MRARGKLTAAAVASACCAVALATNVAAQDQGTPECHGKAATLVVPEGGLVANGTAKADVIVGTAGDDFIRANGGNDLVCAGDGNDAVFGAGGKDKLYGEGGNDTLFGGAATDTLVGGPGADKCTQTRKSKKC